MTDMSEEQAVNNRENEDQEIIHYPDFSARRSVRAEIEIVNVEKNVKPIVINTNQIESDNNEIFTDL